MAGNKHWVGTWATAPAPAEGVVGFNNHTLRMNPRISIGGDQLRVRISNAYGNRPLPIRAARIALRDKGPATVHGSDRKLTFGGSDGTMIAGGAVQFSDPVDLTVQALADLAVSFHLPGEVLANFSITGRYARQTNYISPPGDFTREAVMPVGNRRGIEALSGFADGASKNRLELDLQFALGPCLLAAEGPRSAATAATVTRARELCDADPVCRPTRKTCSKSRWRSRKAKKPDRSNCALPQTSPGSTATRAALPKPATSSRRSTTGSPRASTHKTSKKQRPCSKNYPDLSIAYDIVTQQHGGTIEVDSRVGEFTEFTIRLPRPPAGGTV